MTIEVEASAALVKVHRVQRPPRRHVGATIVAVTDIATRELRNDTAGVLRRVQSGEEVVITVRGEAVARLVPVVVERRRWLPRSELATWLGGAQADPGLDAQLRELTGTADDLPDVV